MPYILSVGHAQLRVEIVGCVGCGMVPKTDGEIEAGSPAGQIAVAVGTSRQLTVPLWRCGQCYLKQERPAAAKPLPCGKGVSRPFGSGAKVSHKLALLMLFLLGPILSGCGEDQIASGFRQYFPNAELRTGNPSVLFVETHVLNVSPAFVAQTWNAFAAGPEIGKVRQMMDLSGYRYMVLSLDTSYVVWDKFGRAAILNPAQFQQWWMVAR